MGLVRWFERITQAGKPGPQPTAREAVLKPDEQPHFESNYLHSSRWDELLSPTDGLPNLRLAPYRGELWLMETTTSKLVVVGNRHLAKLGIWTATVRGIDHYRGAVVETNASPGQRLELVREPGNPHDRNAVQVLVEERVVGYINKQMAARVAKLMDAGVPLETVSLAGCPRGRNESRIQILAADPALILHLTGARN